jgi:hypothetical protein
MRRPDLTSLLAGIAIVLLGVLLLLDVEDAINLDSGWLLAAFAACAGGALVASGFGAREP